MYFLLNNNRYKTTIPKITADKHKIALIMTKLNGHFSFSQYLMNSGQSDIGSEVCCIE